MGKERLEKGNKQKSVKPGQKLSKINKADTEKAEIIDLVSDDEEKNFISSSLEITAIRPLFDSTDLVILDEKSPGVIKEWITLVKESSKNENTIRNRHSIADIALESIGLFLGFFIAVAFLYVAYDLTRSGHDVAGIILGTVDLIGLVSIFVLGKKFASEKSKQDGSQQSKVE